MLSLLTKSLIIVCSLVGLLWLRAPLVHADCNPSDPQSAIECGVDSGAGTSGGSTDAGSSLESIISTVLKLLSIAVGLAAVIMIIVGGFRYITSGGNQEGAKAAKTTLTYALIGLVIVALAQIIVHFVLSNTNGAVSGANDTGTTQTKGPQSP